MRLLLCCEFYFPSVGGVQEVMRHIAERLVKRGHDVTVATTRLVERDFTSHNGVKIAEFEVMGNIVRGMEGEVERYSKFVCSFECDAILIKAAQQWTFDALWPELDQIKARKVFIPCGFSGLFEPSYVQYFEVIPNILKKFDHLIFYAEHYRDVDFARRNHIEKFTILANGACEIEFDVDPDPEFRRKNGIPIDSFVLLTVGSRTGVKGHRELIESFARLKTIGRHVTFIMNGNAPPKPVVALKQVLEGQNISNYQIQAESSNTLGFFGRVVRVLMKEGIPGIGYRFSLRCYRVYETKIRRLSRIPEIVAKEGLIGIRLRMIQYLGSRLERFGLLRWAPGYIRALATPMDFWIAEAKKNTEKKLLIISDYPRQELIQAYMAADLFVFASNIEYSPLVLFESAAAGTPFLSVPVGNAEEIAKWTGGGIICPADKDDRGYTRADPKLLAREIAKAIEKPELLQSLGKHARAVWKERYTWDAIADRYESILSGDLLKTPKGKV